MNTSLKEYSAMMRTRRVTTTPISTVTSSFTCFSSRSPTSDSQLPTRDMGSNGSALFQMPGGRPVTPGKVSKKRDVPSIPTSACHQVFQIFELAQIIFDSVDDGVGLSSAQQTCHLFSQHVRIVKKCMTRSDANERKVIEDPTKYIKFNGAISLFKDFFRPYTLIPIPDTITGAALFVFQAPTPVRHTMQDYYTPAQPHQMPANLNRPPWNLFLSHPPISSAHILEMESSELYRRRPQLTRIRVYAHKGITFGDVMSMMTARRCLDTDMPFMVVLGSEAETLRAAEEFIRRVGEQVSERLQRRRRGGVDEMRSILVVIKRPRADYPQGSVIIARVCGTGLGKRPCM